MLEHPEPVRQGELAHCAFAKAVRPQRRDQMRQTACVPDRAWHHRAIEIRPESHVVLTHAIDQIAQMMHDRVERRVCVEVRVGRTSFTLKLKPTRPFDCRIASSCRSVRLRVEGQIACAQACVATSGAVLKPATSQKPRSLRCDTSIMIPSRLHARTNSLPAAVRPGPVSGERGNANGTPCPKMFGDSTPNQASAIPPHTGVRGSPDRHRSPRHPPCAAPSRRHRRAAPPRLHPQRLPSGSSPRSAPRRD